MLRWFPEMAPRRRPVLCENVEGADLKNNSQSTTHIDPKVGTGGMLHDHVTFGKAGKHRHTPAVSVAKGQAYVYKTTFLVLVSLYQYLYSGLHIRKNTF